MKAPLETIPDNLRNAATIVQPGEGRRLVAGDGSCTFKISSAHSNGQLGIYEIVVPPRTPGALPHYHRHIDEAFLVKKGTLTLDIGNQRQLLQEGAVAYVPRLTPHAFSNGHDEPLELTLLFTPANGREGYFTGLFELLQVPELDVPRFLQLCREYDTHPYNPELQPV